MVEFSVTLVQIQSNIYLVPDFSKVTLVSEDNSLLAHKVILRRIK